MLRAHVVPVVRGWEVRVLGNTRTRWRGYTSAIDSAQGLVAEGGGGEVVVHFPGGPEVRPVEAFAFRGRPPQVRR